MLYNKALELQESIQLIDAKPLKQLLDKKMSRKDFLLHLGAFAISLTGVAAIMKNLTNPHFVSRQSKGGKVEPRRGFGGGTYGN